MVKIVNALVKAAASHPKRNIGDGDGPDEEAEDSRPKKKEKETYRLIYPPSYCL